MTGNDGSKAIRGYPAATMVAAATLVLLAACETGTPSTGVASRQAPHDASADTICTSGIVQQDRFGGPAVDALLQGADNNVAVDAAAQVLPDSGFDLDAIRKGKPVPAVFPASLPATLRQTDDVDARKRLFVSAVLPSVLAVNQRLEARAHFLARVSACRDEGGSLTAAAADRLDHIAKRYGTTDLRELRRRARPVPASLALAQAAIETGWGTSRFAHEGNALFGQHTTDAENGIKPYEVSAESDLHVATFEHVRAAVAAYVHNLNTHAAYATFRARRAGLVETGAGNAGERLAPTLTAYSERGDAYVRDLLTIIRANEFTAFEAATLDRTPGTVAARTPESEPEA